jgi:hypothetical protein
MAVKEENLGLNLAKTISYHPVLSKKEYFPQPSMVYASSMT